MRTTITLSADSDAIEAARARAEREQTTLDAELDRWLADYAGRERHQAPEGPAEPKPSERALATLRELRKYVRTEGRKFTREEMNER